MSEAADVAQLMESARTGDPQSVDSLFAITYQELRRLARVRLRAGGRNTFLDTTSLVHECYLRFADAGGLRIEDRARFLSYASHAMRSVIVDFVRRRQTKRRGNAPVKVTLTGHIGDGVAAASEDEILRVHEALEELSKVDGRGRMVQVVEMRYFGGMTETEIAQVLAVTDRTVRREWEKARLWLAAALG